MSYKCNIALQAEYKAKSRKDYKLVALQMLDQGVKVLNKELNVSILLLFGIIYYLFLAFCHLSMSSEYHIVPLYKNNNLARTLTT